MKWAAALFLAGCTIHLPQNAPGNVDIMAPPREIEREAVETPDDPGEHAVMLSAGGFGGGGVRVTDVDTTGLGELGVEAGLHWGDFDESHAKSDLFFVPHMVIPRTQGVNLGLSWVAHGDEDLHLGTLYAEYQRRYIAGGWAVGVSWDPDTDTWGPEAQAFFGYLYARATVQEDRGFDLTFGAFLKLPQTWVWSR